MPRTFPSLLFLTSSLLNSTLWVLYHSNATGHFKSNMVIIDCLSFRKFWNALNVFNDHPWQIFQAQACFTSSHSTIILCCLFFTWVARSEIWILLPPWGPYKRDDKCACDSLFPCFLTMCVHHFLSHYLILILIWLGCRCMYTHYASTNLFHLP